MVRTGQSLAAWRAILVAALLSVLAGCASQPMVMRFESPPAGSALFPPPQTSEVPRYRYIGQLTGEDNFHPLDGSSRGGARKLLGWIAGLGEETDKPVLLQRPQGGMTDAAGRVLVTDVGRNAVFVFDEPAGKLEVWDRASRSARFEAPIGIAAGRDGEILVTDATLARVFRLGADGAPRGDFGEGLLVRPTGLARDAQRRRIYVADTHAHDIKVFDDDGALVATWGRRGTGPGEFNFPTHLWLAGDMLMVSDSMNARVQGFNSAGQPVLRFGERGLYVGNLVRPKGVAADNEGNLYVVESMHDTLLVFDREGRLLMSLGGSDNRAGRFFLPAGVWLDSRNRVFVADMFNGRVAVFQFLGGK